MNLALCLQPQTRVLLSTGLAALLFILSAASFAAETAQSTPIANFTDIAEKAGLTIPNVFGGRNTKKYIIETTGTGVAIFDYDNDGWPEISW